MRVPASICTLTTGAVPLGFRASVLELRVQGLRASFIYISSMPDFVEILARILDSCFSAARLRNPALVHALRRICPAKPQHMERAAVFTDTRHVSQLSLPCTCAFQTLKIKS